MQRTFRSRQRRANLLGGSWTPRLLASLTAWYDSQDYTTLFQDSALTTAAGVGDVVGGWKDKSGTGYTLTQGTTGNKPTLTASAIKGYAAPYFVTDDYLLNAALGALVSGSDVPFSVWAVMKQASVATRQQAWAFANSGTDTPVHSLLLWETGSLKYMVYRRDDSSAEVIPNGGTNDTNPHVVGVSFPGTTTSVYVDGATVVNAVACNVGVMTVDRFSLGTRGGLVPLQFLNGYVGELVVTSAALSAGDRALLTAYLGKKWGITTL